MNISQELFRAVHPIGGMVTFTVFDIVDKGKIEMNDGLIYSLKDCKVDKFSGLFSYKQFPVFQGDILRIRGELYGVRYSQLTWSLQILGDGGPLDFGHVITSTWESSWHAEGTPI